MTKHLRLLLCLVACCFCFSVRMMAQSGIVPAVDHITGFSAFIHWDGESATSYVVSLAPAGSDSWSDNTVSDPYVLLNNLEPSTSYLIKVRTSSEEPGYERVVPFATRCALSTEAITLGDRTNSNGNFPINTYYNYSVSQQIYTAEEYGGVAKVLDSLVFFLQTVGSHNPAVKIYLGLTHRDHFVWGESCFGTDSLTLVYDGVLPFTSLDNLDGVMRLGIPLDTPFVLDGSSNLVVVINNLSGTYTQYSLFYIHNTPPDYSYRCVYDYRDGSPYDIDNLNSLSYTDQVPDIMFPGACSEPPCIARNLVVTSVEQTSAHLIWTSGCGNVATEASSMEFEFRRVGDPMWTEVYVSGLEQTLTGLTPNTAYEARVRSVCSDENSAWTTVSFYTAPARMNRLYVKTVSEGSGDGSSWSNATSDLAWALDIAASNARAFGTHPQVWVAEGTYTSSNATDGVAFYVGNGVRLYGGFAGTEPDDFDLSQRDPELHVTALSGESLFSVLQMAGSITDTAIADGLSIVYGYGGSFGGVRMLPFSRLENCHVHHCYGNDVGGIYIDGYNGSTDLTVVVDRCKITNNNSSSTSAIIVNNGMVANSLIANNQSEYSSTLSSNSTLSSLIGNTIVNNRGGSYEPTALSFWGDERVENNIIWGNRSSYGSSPQVQVGDPSMVTNNAIENEQWGSNCISLASSNTGSVFSPCFVSPSTGTGSSYSGGEWQLTDQSICINRGRLSADMPSVADLAGNSRVQMDSLDMGCYESPYVNIAAPRYGPHVYMVPSTGSSTMHTGESWSNACQDLQMALSYAALFGADIWMAEGEYEIESNPETSNIHIYGGFVGNEPADYDPALRDRYRRSSIRLDSYESITDRGGLWDGFRFTSNGGTRYGSVFYTNHTTLSNCDFDHFRYSGSVMIYLDSSTTVDACRFTDITMNGNDRWLLRSSTNSTVSNSLFTQISIPYGDLFHDYGSGKFFHNTVAQNSFNNIIFGRSESYLIPTEVKNNVFWNNNLVSMLCNESALLVNNASDVEIAGGNNLLISTSNDEDQGERMAPRFLDLEHGDCRILPNSALVDGVPALADVTSDFNGNSRPYGSMADYGCYEYGGEVFCFAPTIDSVVGVTGHSAHVSWSTHIYTSSPFTPTALLQMRRDDSDVWTDVVSTGSTSHLFDGLDPQTTYWLRVRSTCYDGSNTDWSTPVSFTTQCHIQAESIAIHKNSPTYNYAYYAPTYTTSKYCYSQVIYSREQLNTSMRTIDTIGYSRRSGANVAREIKVYLGNVKRTSYGYGDGYVPLDSLTLVYEGTVNFNASTNDFNTFIPLQNSFVYDPEYNLVVAVYDFTGLAPSTPNQFYGDNTSVYNLRYYTSTNPINLATLSSGNTFTFQPRFYINGICSNDGCAPLSIVADSVSDNAARIVWSASEGTPLFEYKKESDHDYTPVTLSAADQAARSFMLSGLQMNETYRVRMADICASGDTSFWSSLSFTTIVPRMDRIYVDTVQHGNGTGDSWATACGDLDVALKRASAVAERYHNQPQVWVAQGSYAIENSDSSFTIYPGVDVYGGFVGNEPAGYDVALRDLEAHPSVLTRVDNSHYVPILDYFSNNFDNAPALWDGFTVTGGKYGVYLANNTVLNHFIIENNTSNPLQVRSPNGAYITHIDANGDERENVNTKVFNTTIRNNGDIIYMYGGGLYNCEIVNNSSYEYSNSGYITFYNYYAEMINCLVANNKNYTTTHSSAVYVANSNTYMANNIIWGNTSRPTTLSNFCGGQIAAPGNNRVSRNNAIQGVVTDEMLPHQVGTIMLSPDNNSPWGPRFVSVPAVSGMDASDGNWSLTSYSPCLKQGVFDSVMLGMVPYSASLDLGARQSSFSAVTPAASSYNQHIYVSNNGTGLGTSWADAASLSEALIIAHRNPSLDIWMKQGEYAVDTLHGNPYIAYNLALYGGFEGNEDTDYDIALRDFAAHTTTVNANAASRLFTFHNGVIDGVNLVNGRAAFGAAIYADTVLIANSVLKNNLFSVNGSGDYYGGAIYATGLMNAYNCSFLYNGGYESAYTYGGVARANAINVVNSLVANNTAYGTATFRADTLVVTNSVFTGHHSMNTFNIMDGYSYCVVNNSVLWNNNRPYTLSSSTLLNYSAVDKNSIISSTVSNHCKIISSSNPLFGNADSPAFVDSASLDLHILPHSALLDQGDSTLFQQAMVSIGLDGYKYDHDGKNRIWGGNIDMGCFEYTGEIICNPVENLAVEVFATTANVTWTPNSFAPADTGAVATPGIHTSQLMYSLVGSGLWDTINVANADVYMLNGLLPETDYVVKVRTICAPGSFGLWSDEVAFTTTCVGRIPDVEFTNGNSTTSGITVPVAPAFGYSYNQQLLFASELTGRDTIREIAFQYDGVNAITRNLTLYMGNTSIAQFNTTKSWIASGAMTQVFSGSVTFDRDAEDNQWVTIHFTNPFVYDGSSNVVLAIDDNTGSSSSGYGYFRTHPTATNSVLYARSSSTNYNPGSMSTVSGSYLSTRSNIKLAGWCDPDYCPVPTVVVSSVSDSNATIVWGGAEVIEMQYRKVGEPVWNNCSTAHSTVTISSLRPFTDYEVRYRNYCSIGNQSAWQSQLFTTEMRPVNRLYVKIPAGRNADGSSWTNATDNLAWALRCAEENKARYGINADIWVAKGTYYGDTTLPYAFTMVEGVNVYGGFHGYESADFDLNERNFEINPTILDGAGRQSLLKQETDFYTTPTTWDGFVFQNGYSSTSNIIDIRAYGCIANSVIKNNHVANQYILHAAGSWGVINSVVRNTKVINNTASENYSGVAYFNTAASVNNLFANNTFGSTAVLCDNSLVLNCDVVNNYGTGYYPTAMSGSNVNCYNNIVWGNQGSSDLHLTCDVSGDVYNCAFENGPSSNNCISLPSGNSGGVPTYVSFVQPSAGAGASYTGGNWNLDANSICIDHGARRFVTNLDLWCYDALGLTHDLAGGVRVLNDSVDIGCYESGNPAVVLPEYPDGIIFVDARSTAVDRDGTSWDKAFDKLSDALTFASFVGGVDIWVAEGTYVGNENRENAFTAVPGVNVYGGLVGNEPVGYDLSLRDIEHHTTILSGMDLQRVVYFSGESTWDGFTIERGYCAAGDGGAVYMNQGTLRNCTFRNNSAVDGGAIYAVRAVIEDCEFYSNEGRSSCGAIYVSAGANIRRVRVHHNHSNYGGAITGNNIVLSNALISDNYSEGQGFALHLGGNNFVNHTTIVRNYNASDGPVSGSGAPVFLNSNGSVFRNTVVWGNKNGFGDHVNIDAGTNIFGSHYSADIQYCAIENYPSYIPSNINLDSNNVGGFINRSYPYFRSISRGDFSLGELSACLNNGVSVPGAYGVSADWLAADTLDLNGNLRANGVVDMGCFESWNDQLCLEPHNVRFDYVGGYSAMVMWDCDNADANDHYELQYALATSDTWTTIPVEGRLYAAIDGLVPETAYKLRIRHQCADATFSPYTDNVLFTTDCPMRSGGFVLGDDDEMSDMSPFLPKANSTSYMYIQPRELDSIPRRIDSIAFQYVYDVPMTRNIAIYINRFNDMNRARYALHNGFDISGSNVFTGTVEFTDRGHDHWVNIPLDNPYDYDGSSVLILTIKDTTTGIDRYQRVLSRFAATYTPDTVYTVYGTTEYFSLYRANMRFSGECDTMDCISPRISAFDVSDTSARLVWSGGNNNAAVDVQLRAKNSFDFVDIANVASANGWTILRNGNEIFVTGLTQFTDYEARVRSNCGHDNLGLWNIVDFTTTPLYQDIIYVTPRPHGLADGSSWDNATGDINRGTSLAKAIGDCYGVTPPVWVAQGTYYGDTTNQDAAFMMPVGVKVYGGFEGNEPSSFDYESFVANPELTILDGMNRHRVMLQKSSPRDNEHMIRWSGFTIMNGSAKCGAGVSLKRFAMLENCIIRNNEAEISGGGVHFSAGVDLSQTIYSVLNPTPTTMYYLQDQYSAALYNCKLFNNVADRGSAVDGTAIALVNCLVANNTAITDAAVFCDSLTHVIVNTTIVNNMASHGDCSGLSANNATVRNCIIWGNRIFGSDDTDNQLKGGTIFSTLVEDGVADIPNSYLSSSNTGDFYSPAFVHPSSGAGTAYSDGDWRLSDGSYCVNRVGASSLKYEDAIGRRIVYNTGFDLAYYDRVQMDSLDLGCYESPYRGIGTPIYLNRIYVTTTGNGNRSGNSWDNAMSSISAAQHVALSNSVNTVWVAEGIYSTEAPSVGSMFKMLQTVNVYGAFQGNETGAFDLNQRDFVNHATILDGRNVSRVLSSKRDLNKGEFCDETTWDGFTIRNGRVDGGVGGGVYITRNFHLNNCIIENCFARTGGGVAIGLQDNSPRLPGSYNHQNYGTLTNCIIRNNVATDTAGGVRSISGYLENCLIADNRSYGLGGGVEAVASSFVGCAIVNNVQGVDTCNGGGLLQVTDSIRIESVYFSGSFMTSYVSNSVLWGNRNGLIENSNYSGRVVITNSAISGEASGSNILVETDNDGYDVSKNYVRFADPAQGDYSLTEMSDLLNRGVSGVGISRLDLFRNPRQVGASVDLGPIEFQETEIACPAPYAIRPIDVTTNSISLSWSAGSGSRWAVSYALPNEEPVVTMVEINNITLTGLTPHRDYTVRVRTICDDTTFSAFSSAIVLRTACDTASMTPLSDFSYFNPPYDEVIKAKTINFSWNSLPQATSYDLYLWPETDTVAPDEPFIAGLTTPYVFDVDLPSFSYDRIYYWKVVAWNECLSKESDIQMFTTAGNRRLHVTAIDCSDPMSGHEMTIEWTVRNDGTGRTPPSDVWYDKVWITRYCEVAPTGDSEIQHQLASFVNVRALNPGESYTNRKNIRIPDTCMGTWYLMILTDTLTHISPYFMDCGGLPPVPYNPSLTGIPYPFIGHTPADVDADSVELLFPGQMHWGDHFSYMPIEIAQAPLPDLKPTELVHPVDVYSRTNIDVTYKIYNQGDADAERTWTDKVVIVKEEDVIEAGLLDPVYGFSGSVNDILNVPEVFSRTYTHTGGLVKDTFYEGHVSFALPMEMHGNYYMYVYTNSGNSLYESLNYNNNILASNEQIRVTLFPTADLVVDTITVADSIPVMANYSFSYTIKNQGTGDCAPDYNKWVDSIFFSPDSLFRTSNMRRLAVVEHEDTIMKDSVMVVNVEATMPDNIKGDWYIFVKTNAKNIIFEYNADTNNVLCSHPIHIQAPDLEVRNITYQGPDTISHGQELIVEYDVVNAGTADAHRDTWRDGIYLSHSYMFSFASAIRVGNVRHSGGLQKDSAYHVATSVVIPDDIAGYWTIHVYSDRDSSLYEQDLELNNHAMGDNRINVLQPDLVVENVLAPDTMYAGRRAAVTWTIKNQGRGTILNKEVENYVFVDEIRVAVLNTEFIEFAPGDSLVVSTSFEVPCVGQPSGNVTVRVDATELVNESVENNNLSGVVVVPMGSPDFTVDNVSIPSVVASGQEITLSWRVSNVGTVDVVNTVIPHRIYMSHTMDFDTLGYNWTMARGLTLHVGESATVSQTIRVPYDVEGSYYFHVVANDPTVNNNVCEASNVASNVGSSDYFNVTLSDCPDLVIDSIAMPSSMYTSSSTNIMFRLMNNGVAPTYGIATHKFYLSPSATEYFEDALMGSQGYSRVLSAGDTVVTAARITVPVNTAAGHYYVWAVADANNDIYERDGESNNAALCAELDVMINPFDLGIISFSAPDTITWNETYSATFTIQNLSTITAPATRLDAIFVSNDSVLDVNDVRLNAISHTNSIRPGQTEDIALDFLTPMGLDTVVYLIAATDYLMATPDVLLENNTAVIRMPVKSIPTPDLMVTSVRLLHDTLMSGEPDRLSYTVTNVGDAPLVHARWTDQLYLSADTILSENDIPLSSAIIADSIINIDVLNPGDSYDWAMDLSVPLPLTGDYYLLTYTNARNVFYETTRKNNIKARHIYVDITRPCDLVVRSIDGPDTITLGRTVSVEWDVVNVGEDIAHGDGLVSLLYLSLDTIFDSDDKLLVATDPIFMELNNGEYVHQAVNVRLSGVPEDDYYFVVLTDVRNAFYEVNERNNTTVASFPVTVKVRELPFNTPVADTFYNGLMNDYKLIVGDHRNQTVLLHLDLEDSTINAANHIYVSYNSIGDNLNYTYSSVGQVTATPETYIPNTTGGYYGVSVFTSLIDDTVMHADISADEIPFGFSSVTPNYGGNTGEVTVELRGSRFRPDMKVSMYRGTDTIMAKNVQFDDYYRAYATFDLTDADTGVYDMGIDNFCDGEALLPQSFTVQPGAPRNLAYIMSTPNGARVGKTIVLQFEYGNHGNTDIVNTAVTIRSVASPITNNPDGTITDNYEIVVPMKLPGRDDCVLPPGARGTVTIYCLALNNLFFIYTEQPYVNE